MNADLLSAAGASGPAGAKRVAGAAKDSKPWQRQLQRAQAAGWFCRSDRLSTVEVFPAAAAAPVDGSSRPLAAGPGRRAAFSAKPGLGLQLPLALTLTGHRVAATGQPVFAGGSGFAAMRQATPVGPAPASLTPSLVASQAASPARRVGEVHELLSMEQRPATEAARAQDDHALVRFHIEEGPQGLRLWLGADGTPTEVAARAGAVAAELRRQCERTGLRLVEVTCNGVPFTGEARAQVSSREEP